MHYLYCIFGGRLNIAPVRNLKSIGRPKPIPVRHFIPPRFAPIYKIEVVTDTETIDVTELLVEGSYLDGVTNSIGDFTFKLLDPSNTESDRIEEFDTVNVYLDYGKTATTLRFTGKIERKSNQENIYLTLSGRSIAMITTGVNVIYSSGGFKARSDILKDIVAKYFSDIIITGGIEDDLTEIEVNYEEMPFWNVVEEICVSGGRDAYISAASVFNYFIKGSRENPSEAVVEDINLVEAIDYAIDTQEVYTKVRVYGQQDGNVPLIASAESGTTHTKGIVKELKINNSNITTEAQAAELASATAEDKKLPPTLGSIISLLLPTILPGEKINIANPTNNIPPAAYQINSFRQIFSVDGSPTTELIIQKQMVSLSTIMKSNIKFQFDSPNYINKNDLDSSLILDYDNNNGLKRFNDGIFEDTELEVNNSTGIGVLKTTNGNTTGRWTSENIIVDAPVTIIELRINATNAEGTKYFISLDGGSTYKEIESATGDFDFPNAQNMVKLRVEFKSSETKIEKLGLLYNTV